MEALRKPKTTTDDEAGMITSHRPGMRPELLRPYIDARRRLTPWEDQARSTHQPTAPPTTPGTPLTKRAAKHRHLHSDGTKGRADSCTRAGEAGLHLHMLVAGTGEKRHRGREKQGSTLFQADVAAATASMTSSEP
jgi:hypothetical protein